MVGCGLTDRCLSLQLVHQIIIFRLMFYALRVILFPLGLYFGVSDKIVIFDWCIIILGGSPIEMTVVIDSVAFLFSSSVFFISGNVC